MFPKCSKDVSNIATLREYSANIPGILRASWGAAITLSSCTSELSPTNDK